MSGVADGQVANESTFDSAYMFSNGNTGTIGTVFLNNTSNVNSGPMITNVQRYINELADASGVAGEGDANRKVYANHNYIASGDNRKIAIGKLDAQLKLTQTDLDAAEVTIANHEGRISTIEGLPSTFGGDKTFSNNVIVQGNFTVNGTTTFVNSTDLQVVDKNILVNKDGNDASAEGAGVDVQRTSDNGAFRFDSTLTSKWKVGLASAMYEILVSGIAQTILGLKSFVDGIATNTISEQTANAGVTVDGVLLKDSLVDGRDVSADGSALDSHLANSANPHSTTAAQVGLGNVTNDAQLKRAANDFSSFTEKTTLAADDVFLIEDSAAAGAKKFVKKSNLGAGSGSGGGLVNFITNGDAENAVSSIFVPYADTGTRPVDGTGGSPDVTSSVSSINPLIGAKSFLLTKPALNTQGQGWSIPTTSLDVAYRAKSLKVSIDYIVNSGTFVAGSNNTESDVILYFYDITNGKLVEPSNIKFFSNSSTISDKIEATVQFDSNCIAFRTIIHCQSSSTLAYELKVDNVTVSPQSSVYANAQTSPVQYQPTWTGLGSVTNNSMYWQRDGSDMVLWGYVTTGTVTNNAVTFTLPNGYAIDTARLSSNLSRRHNFGYAHRLLAGGNTIYSDGIAAATMVVVYQGTGSNTPQLTYTTTTGAFGDTNATGMFTSGDSISISPLRIPILGWDASSRVSDSYDGREISGQVTISANLAMTTGSPILFPVVAKDTTGSYNASTGQIKIPSSGEYEFTLTEAYNNTSGLYILLYKNGTPVSLISYSSAAGILTMSYPAKINCNAGDLIDARPSNNTNALQYSAYTSGTGYVPKFSWKKNQNSQAISATEKVYCSYTSTSGQSIPNNSATTVLFGNKIDDSHGAYNPSNGRITLPRAGAGYISATNTISAAAAGTFYIQVFKNGSLYKTGVQIQGTAFGSGFCAQFSGIAGDYFEIRFYQNTGSARSLDVNPANNHFDFFMI